MDKQHEKTFTENGNAGKLLSVPGRCSQSLVLREKKSVGDPVGRGVELDEIWQKPPDSHPPALRSSSRNHTQGLSAQPEAASAEQGKSPGAVGRTVAAGDEDCTPTLGPGNGTLPGRRVFEHVIEDLGMRNLSWITWWALNPKTGVLLRGRLDRHGKRGTQRRRPGDGEGRGWSGGPRGCKRQEGPPSATL